MSVFYVMFLVFMSMTVGTLLCLFIVIQINKNKSEELDLLIKSKIEEARLQGEQMRDSIIKNAENKYLDIMKNAEKNIEAKMHKIKNKENELLLKDYKIQSELDSVLRKQDTVKKLQREVEDLRKEKIKSLEFISNISADEAKKQLTLALENEARFKAAVKTRKIIDEATANANIEAKKIIINAIQRLSIEQTIENASTVIKLEDNTQKGIIIGKDGRNIKSLEENIGVDIVIDETPSSIIISSFDPVRREIARITIQHLLQDGRVHPARIEDTVSKVKNNIEKEIFNTGQNTILDLGIYGVHEELIKLIGKMKYRSSYGHNLLHHSKEVAKLSAIMASELGLNVEQAKRAGLLHDIGKVTDHNEDVTHAILGMKIAEKYGESQDICNAIGAHHDEIEMSVLIAPITQICDSISGARPGARRDSFNEYTKRLGAMEQIALSREGVKNCYAIQAGRELRVIVDANEISDEKNSELAFDIARQIENDLQYPGQIKIIVIREKRSVSIAK